MAGGLPINRLLVPARRAGFFLVLLVLPVLAWAWEASPADPAAANDADAADSRAADTPIHSPSFGPPGQTPDVPTPEELEGAGAVIGQVLIDNQNIFNLDDPKD